MLQNFLPGEEIAVDKSSIGFKDQILPTHTSYNPKNLQNGVYEFMCCLIVKLDLSRLFVMAWNKK